MDIKSILSNIFQFAKNNQFRVKLDDTLDLEPIREALADRQNSDELLKSLLVTQNAMLVRDKVEEADKKIEITNKSFEKAKKELDFTREEIEKLDAKVKELNNFKGEKGDSPSLQELREIIEPLILPPIKGDPGKDYVLTSKDKKEIAKSIKVPIVEKIVETIIEKQPIVTNEIKEVAVTDTSEKIKEKLESLEGDERLDAKAIKNLPKPSFGGGIKRIDGALDTRIISPTDGQALVWNSSRQVWENSSVSGGSGSPGGSDTQVQFNDGGSFGGDAGLTYNNTTDTLNVDTIASIGETFEIDAGDATTPNGNGGDIVLVTGAKDGSGLDGRLKVSRGSDNLSALLDVDDLTDDRSIAFPDKDGTLAIVSDVAYDATTWDGNTDVPTKNAVRDKIETLQPLDADLTTIAGLTATTNNIIQSVSSSWASRTPTQVTATLDAMVGDSGAGGTKGLVPAPATGDATKFLKGDGTWGTPAGSGDALTTGPLSQFAATTSLQLAGVISDETGSGSLVFGTSPRFTTAANPVSNDGAALGTTALGWSDLFLASGGVINFNAGNMTLTHAAGSLTLSNGNFGIGGTTPSVRFYITKTTTVDTFVEQMIKMQSGPSGNQDAFTVDNLGNVALNAGGQANGGVTTVNSKINSDTLVDIFSAGLDRGGGNGGVGLGLGYLFRLEGGGGTRVDAGRFKYVWSTATAGSETSTFTIQNKSAGSLVDALVFVGGDATFVGSLSIGTSNALTCGTIELGAASDTTIARVSAGVISVEGVTIPSISSTNTLTNKRITPRVSSETSSATPTINTDNVDAHSITALAADITSFTTNLSGTPTNFQKLLIRIKDNGTARGITWGTSFEAKGVALPTTTTISKVLTVGFIYDSVTSKWGCVCSVNEA